MGNGLLRRRVNREENRQSAVVVGASLSGLMTGIALAREGIHVTMVEKAGEERGLGSGLRVDGGTFGQSKTERLLRKLASGGRTSVQLWSSIERRMRAEAKADPQIELRYKTRVASVDQDENAVWIVTDEGETIRGDILVGADGHRSVVRGLVAPHNPDATFAGYMVWMAAVNENDLPEACRPGPEAQEVTMLDGGIDGFLFGSVMDLENGFFSPGARRIGCTWYDNSRNNLLRRLGCVEGAKVQHSLKGSDIPEETLRLLADQAASKWPEPWATVTVQAIEARSIIGIPIKEYVPDKLVNGRIALVGDAAHVPAPVTASGFNQSLQDAVALGQCVAKGIHGTAASEALKEYESLRLRSVRQIVQSGQYFSRTFGRA